MKTLVRFACVLLVTLLGACGGGDSGATGSNGTSRAPAQQDARLVLDSMSWDQGDWAE